MEKNNILYAVIFVIVTAMILASIGVGVSDKSISVVGDYSMCSVNDISTSATTTGSSNRSSIAVIEQSSRMLLSGENVNTRLPMASTTKIMTALCVLNNISDIDAYFKIPKEAVGIEGSSIYLQEGDEWTVRQLLYGLMLRSGNDSATALAIACSGSVANFVNLMNSTAKNMGLKDTHFMNPHGLHDEEHYTTAYELALISATAMDNDIFKEIVGSKFYKFTMKSGETRAFANKNKILSMCDGGNGIKTGYTKKAGRCLVSSAKRDNMQLICVALNHGDMWNDCINSMESIFNKYNAIKLVEGNKDFAVINTSDSKINLYVNRDIYLPIHKSDALDFSFRFIPLENLTAGVLFENHIGTLEIFVGERLLFCEKVYTMVSVLSDDDVKAIQNYEYTKGNHGKNKTEQIYSFNRLGI